ncbi:DUF7312 domain-containing protein [Salinilacihabitans rarus]|uniref:DUF7312 domain-containing protein n=1 Tax=Salinilacihabitans rarus TaxID=2961596 RepID=UPI0020C9352F|nr:hypothetical protein [Salinilacihabitans rarus]
MAGDESGSGADDHRVDPTTESEATPDDSRWPATDERGRDRTDSTDDPNEDDEWGEGPDPYAPEPSSAPVEPEEPTLENAIFVLLGVFGTVLVLLRLAGAVGG